jgi:hypothetical protein
MYIDSVNERIVGPPMVSAYELEQQQEWMGAIVDPAHADRYQQSIQHGPVREFVVKYRAPMKSGQRSVYLCVGWTFRIGQRDQITQAFKDAELRHDSYRKYKNTLEFYDSGVDRESDTARKFF